MWQPWELCFVCGKKRFEWSGAGFIFVKKNCACNPEYLDMSVSIWNTFGNITCTHFGGLPLSLIQAECRW